MKRSSLNHIYRVVWNSALQVWQVVSEVSKGRGKTKTAKSAAGTTLAQLFASGALLMGGGGALAELPNSGQISAGQGNIASDGSSMVIHQHTDRMAIDWQSFNIGAGNKLEFLQPSASSIALNRVLGGDPSQIRGSLIANGRVFLVNPSGIVFGEKSEINVAGIVASTLNISNQDFMSGNFKFEGSSNGVIVNKGNVVTEQGGLVVLIAAKIENVGRLNAPGGNVVLASGQRVRLDLGGPVKIEVDGSVVDGYIKNGGIIQADGGNIVLTVNAADQLASLAINNTGVIQARGIGTGNGGTIRLSASGQGAVENSGIIDASSENGKGGSIHIDAAKIVMTAGSSTIASGLTVGGEIKLNAKEILINEKSTLDVSQKAKSTTWPASEPSLLEKSNAQLVPSSAPKAAELTQLTTDGDNTGGNIQIDAHELEITDSVIDARGADLGGGIFINSKTQSISGSLLDVSGAVAGGHIRVDAPVDLPEAPRQPQPQGPAPAPNTIVVSNSVLRSDAENGEGGNIELTADELDFLGDNTVSANGALGGGNIKLGGGYQGNDASIANAARTFVSAGTLITANAAVNGTGGEVIVWADGYTLFEGHIEAKGGTQGGDGGFAEVSGKDTLAFRGTVDLTAAQGEVGTLLLDPTNLTITATDNLITNPITVTSGSASIAPTGAASTLSVTTLLAALSNSNVVVTTNGSPDTGAEVGTITVASSLDYDSPYKLTLTTASAGGVVINSGVNITNIGFGGFEVNAGTAGVVLNNSALNFAGGAVVLNSNGVITGTGSITTTAPVDTGVASGQVRFVSAGNINFTGLITTTGNDNNLGQASSAGQVIVSSTGGSVVLGRIVAVGGNNDFNLANSGEFGGSGGQGGAVQISAGSTGSAAAHSIQVADITTTGGIGREGVGGGGGTIAITTRGNNTGTEANQIIVGAMTTTGGANTLGGYNGGNAGNIIIQAARVSDDSIRLQGNIAAVGGASTTPSPQGLGGNIRFKSAVKIDTVEKAIVITTGATNGDITFESTTDSYAADTAESLTITAGTGNVFFQNEIGLSNSQAKELNALTVSARTITANRSITARGGVSFTATTGNVLGDSTINSQSVVINTNRDLGGIIGQGAITLNAGTDTNKLYADVTVKRGSGAVSISGFRAITATMNSGDTIGRNYDIAINGTGSLDNSNGHVTINGTNGAAIINSGNVSLSKIGNLSITGAVTADNLIYQDKGSGSVTFSNRYTSDTHTYRTSATTDLAQGSENAGAHGLYINTVGAITLNNGITLSQSAARTTLVSEEGLLNFTSAQHSNLTTSNGMIYLKGLGVSQANGNTSYTPIINAGNQRIIIDGSGAAITLGGRLSTTNNDKVTPSNSSEVANSVDNPAILIRNATTVLVTGISNNKQGTLQIGSPKMGSVLADVTGNVTQRNQQSNGIAVKTISAYTGADITITSTENNFDHTGTIELGGKLNIQSDYGGLSLLGDITATQVRLATGDGALALGDWDVKTVAGNGDSDGNGSISLIGMGVNQLSNSVVDAGASTISINGRDVRSNVGSSGNIDLAGKLITTNSSSSAIHVFHGVETNSTIKVGKITALFGQVTLGSTLTTLGSGSTSGGVSQHSDDSAPEMIIQAKQLLVQSRGSVILNNDNELEQLLGIRYGGAVDIKDMDGLLLMGNVSNYFNGSFYAVKLQTVSTDDSDASLLNLNGNDIIGNGITLLGQGSGSNETLSGGVQSSAGTLNATFGKVLVDAGEGKIDFTNTTITTQNTANDAVSMLNTGEGGHVTLGAITAINSNDSASGGLVLGSTTDSKNIGGNVTQTNGTILRIGRVAGQVSGNVTLGNNNIIRNGTGSDSANAGVLADFVAGGSLTLKNIDGSNLNRGLRVTGAVSAGGLIDIETNGGALNLTGSLTGVGVSLESNLAAGQIILAGNISASSGDVTLIAAGRDATSLQSITQSAGVITTSGKLTGTSQDLVSLAQANNIAQLGPFTASARSFTLSNLGRGNNPLTLVGNVTAPTDITITTSGLFDASTFNISSSTGLVKLNGVGISQSAGSVISSTSGKIDANDAAGSGGVHLNAGGGAVQLAGSLSTGNAGLKSSSIHAILIQNASTVQLGQITASSGRFTLGLNETNKGISGATTQTAGTSVSASELQVYSGSSVTLGNTGNTMTTLNSANTTGGFNLFDSTGGLILAGNVVESSNGDVAISTLGGALSIGLHDITASGSGNINLSGVGVTNAKDPSNTSVIDSGSGTIGLDGGGSGITLAGDLTTTHNTDGSIVLKDATSVSLSNVTTGAAGSLTLGVQAGNEGVGAVTQIAGTKIVTGTVQAYASRSAKASIALANADNEYTKLGYITSAALDLYSKNTGGLTWVGDVDAAGTTSITSLGAINLDTFNLLATGSTLNLTGVDVSQSTSIRGGAATPSTVQAASTNIQAGSGSIGLLSANNDFTGTVQLSATGADAEIRDRNALVLASIIRRTGDIGLAGSTGITAIAGTTLQLAQEAIIKTSSGKVDLRALEGNFQTSDAITTVDGLINITQMSSDSTHGLSVNHALSSTSGTITLSGNKVVHSNAGDLTTSGVGGIEVTATLDAATSGSISMVDGTVFTAGTGGITLNAVNDVSLTVATTTGNAAVMSTKGAIKDVSSTEEINLVADLVTLNAKTGVGTNLPASGDINLSANTLVLTTDTVGIFITNDKAVTLGDASAGPGQGEIKILTSGDLSLIANGTINTAKAISAVGNGSVHLETTGSSQDIIFGSDVTMTGGSLSLKTANGHVAQTNGAISTAAITVDAGGDVTLAQADNDFTGAVVVKATGDLSLRDLNAIQLGRIDLTTGALSVQSNGAISQSAAITQAANAGAVSINAGAGSIALNNADNEFTGSVSLQNTGANNVSVTDKTAIMLGASNLGTGALAVNAVGITQTGAVVQASGAGLASFNAGAAAINLNNTDNVFTTVSAYSTDGGIVLSEKDGFAVHTLNAGSASALTLQSGGEITTAAGQGQITAGALSAKTLNNAGAAITLTNTSNNVASIQLQSRNVADDSNVAGTLTFVDVNGFVIEGLQTSGAAVLNAGAAVTQNGEAVVNGLALKGAGSFSIDDVDNQISNFASEATGDVYVVSSTATIIGAVNPTGVVTSNADFALKASSITIHESINAGTGNVYLETTDASGAMTQASGKGIVAAGLAIKAMGNVTLTDASNNVTKFAANMLTADKTLSYRDVDGLTVANLVDVAAAGNTVAGLTTIGTNSAVIFNVGGLLTQESTGALINLAGALSIDSERSGLADVSVTNTHANGTVLGETLIGGDYTLLSAADKDISQVSGTQLVTGGTFDVNPARYTGSLIYSGIVSGTASPESIRLSGVITLSMSQGKLVATSSEAGAGEVVSSIVADASKTITVTSVGGNPTLTNVGTAQAISLTQGNNIAGPIAIHTQGTFTASSGAKPTGIIQSGNLDVAASINFVVLSSLENGGGTIGAVSGEGTITLTNSTNRFGGSVSATATNMNISITDSTALSLGHVTGSTVTLDSGSNAITQSGIITATNLLVSGAGAVTLDGANKVGTVATGSVAGFNFANAQALSVGTVSSTNGITSTGPVVLAADGLTVSEAIAAADQSVTLKPYTSATAINFGGTPSTAGELNLTSADMGRITAGHLIVGSSDAGAITVGAIDRTSDLSLINNANISIAGALDVGAKNLVINSAGSVTQTAAMTAAGLGLLGSGSFTFTNVGNSVTTLAGGTTAQNLGALNFVNAGALTVGSVNPVGIESVGAVDISTVAGNLTVSESISGSSVLLHAGNATLAGTSTGGDVQVTTGKTVTASTGNVLIYTGSLAGSTGVTELVGSGSGNFRYNGDENTSYTGAGAIGATGVFAIYRERPTISVAPGSASTPYGDAPNLSSVLASYSGLVNGDTVTQAAVTGTALYTTTATSTSNVGSYNIAYASGLLSAIGYAFTDNTSSLNEYSVAQRVISLSGSRIYNRLDTVEAAALDDFGNLAHGQTLTLTGVGSVADENVDVDKPVIIGALALGNGTGLASNYTLDGGTHTLTITPQSISASGITALDKEYDGNVVATLVTSGAGFTGLIAGDVVTLNASGVFADKNVSYDNGTVIAKTVTTTGPLTLSGDDAGNYTITGTTGEITAKITPRTVTLSATKEYDGTTDLTGAQVSIGRLVTDEDLTYSNATASDKNVLASGNFINAIALGNGTDGLASNYALPALDATNAQVTITAKTLTATLANQTKVYDGNIDAVLALNQFGLTGFVLQEGASITKTTGLFNSKDVNSKDVVGATSVTVTLASDDFAPESGTVLSNYVLPNSVSNTASSITPKSLTLTLNGLTKTYDGNANFAVGASDYDLDGFIGDELATLTGATALFNSQNVWEANTASLNVTSINYEATDGTGMLLTNYNLPTVAGLANAASFSITAKTVQLSATKMYDGTTDLTESVNINTGIVGESLDYIGAQSSSKDVAVQNKFISAIELQNTASADTRNYQLPTLAAPDASVVTINPFAVSFTGSRTYDGTTQAQASDLTLGALVGNETLGLTGMGSVDDKHVANNKTVNVTGLTLVDGEAEGEETSVGLATNYTFTGGTHQLNVTKANLTITSSNVDKVYDTNTSANGTAVVAAGSATQLFDNDTLSGGSFAFNNKLVSRDANTGEVLSNKSVTVSGVTVNDGNSGDNYEVTYIDNTTSRIDPATLQVVGLVALDKVYDGSSAANLSTSSAVLNGVLTGDNVTANSATGHFANKDVSYDGRTIIAKAVVADAIQLSGTDAGNYIMTPVTGLSAKITPLGIRPSVTAEDRQYDGTRTATVVANLVLPFALDFFEIEYDQNSALFEDASAGLNKFVSVSGIQPPDGQDPGNYVLLTDTAVTFADILPRQITITADDKSRFFGAPDPILTFTQSGLINGDLVNVRFDVPRGASVPVGNYQITPFGFDNQNYAVTYQPGLLTVNAISQPNNFSVDRSTFELPVASSNQINLNAMFSMPLSESFIGGQIRSQTLNIGNLQLIDVRAGNNQEVGTVGLGQINERALNLAVAQIATSVKQGVLTRVLAVDGGIKLED